MWPARTISAFLALTFSSSQALAWDVEGHQIVGAIAEAKLSPEAKKLLDELLEGAKLSDAKVGAWADIIRGERPETKPWHYVNVPKEAAGYEKSRDCPDGQCTTEQLAVFFDILKDGRRPRAERREALLFLSHLLADLHQPLHAGDRRDRGGNTIGARIGSSSVTLSLHEIWDTDVVTAARGKNFEAFAARLAGQKEPVGAFNFAAWTTESHREALIVYRGVPEGSGVHNLPATYPADQKVQVERVLRRAGARLAAMIEKVVRP